MTNDFKKGFLTGAGGLLGVLKLLIHCSDKDTSALYGINFYTQMCVIQLRSIHLHSSTESHIQSMR